MKTFSKKKFILILIILFIVFAGVFIYQWWQTKKELTEENINWKTYRNEEWEFEFRYPENWSFHEDTFYSPFSKFNLAGAPIGERYQIDPPLLINIVTLDFADSYVINMKNLGATTSDLIVGGIRGTKYEYIFESIPQVDINLSLGEYLMILGTKKQYEDIFNQILATFKFLE
ncbi:hypothetical protein COT77_01995 [Candidatus Berkelbacteria bacterium CG10_big_fil_rev_8_21_14_0_10_41_12]|uniref:Uncharacterized protein n=1 Tax=Candidatus Berkelbacteria bacterium CG10_big_fil_rev_8_21_14_0_10_41_12 TaxID=1974513 RepID=A0A2M6WX66_9BACT|nr:MAG: hypothetical protein COT77_01995 [Candidatus Berkelbacteria bacterium CG10_big_fil_rev_8_21_14_0_10_41_12]